MYNITHKVSMTLCYVTKIQVLMDFGEISICIPKFLFLSFKSLLLKVD